VRAGAPQAFRLTVNGHEETVEASGKTPLLWVLRDRLGLVGTRFGCGLGVCGSCTVLEGAKALRSCQLPIELAAGRSFTTIEGLSPDGSHPVQRAWLEEDVAQCGYCQSGLILETVALLAEKPDPSDAEIDVALYDIVCRCGTYVRVRKAVRRAAELLRDAGAGPRPRSLDPDPPAPYPRPLIARGVRPRPAAGLRAHPWNLIRFEPAEGRR